MVRDGRSKDVYRRTLVGWHAHDRMQPVGHITNVALERLKNVGVG